jgi:triacylglycerol lipase
MKKVLIGIIVLLIALPMVSMAASTKAATKYPIVLSHGMGANANVMGITDYWGSIPKTMRNNGAQVYITSGNPMQSKENKAIEWKAQVKEILAITSAKKINLIGHSDGGLYTRYALSNLNMASSVASYTSMSSPHRGSPVADAIMNLGATTGLTSAIAGALDFVYSFILSVPGTDCGTNGTQETTWWMKTVFNPNVPDIVGVYYQSYGADAKTVIGGQIMTALWLAMLADGDGANDGLVQVSSAKWGNYRGTLTGWFGVNHLSEIGLLELPVVGYDPPTQFVNIAADLKARGY